MIQTQKGSILTPSITHSESTFTKSLSTIVDILELRLDLKLNWIAARRMLQDSRTDSVKKRTSAAVLMQAPATGDLDAVEQSRVVTSPSDKTTHSRNPGTNRIVYFGLVENGLRLDSLC
jgi:hypothetical protein